MQKGNKLTQIQLFSQCFCRVLSHWWLHPHLLAKLNGPMVKELCVQESPSWRGTPPGEYMSKERVEKGSFESLWPSFFENHKDHFQPSASSFSFPVAEKARSLKFTFRLSSPPSHIWKKQIYEKLYRLQLILHICNWYFTLVRLFYADRV